jgi:hypothetical protein
LVAAQGPEQWTCSAAIERLEFASAEELRAVEAERVG